MSTGTQSLISDDIPLAVDCEPAEPPPKAEPWFDLCQKPDTGETELIRHRFLCQGGGLLLVGQTGTGKSSFSRQMALHFALGKPFVGIEPVRPLRSLIIQAENDDGDEAEMCQGIVSGSGFTSDQLQSAGPFIYHFREQCRSGFTFFKETVKPLIEEVKPDIVWIDPLLAYLGGDQNSQEVVGTWLRNLLNPILSQNNCAVAVVHHTSKVSLKSLREGWATSDFGYLGAGSAEFANWSRAIMCLIPSGVQGVYELHAAKRGMRLRWTQTDGATPTTKKIVHHSRKFGEICWHEAMGEEVSFVVPPNNGKPIPSMQEFVSLLPTLGATSRPRDGLLSAGEIRNQFSKKGWKRDSYAGVCEEACRTKKTALVQEGRGNRLKLYGRPEVVDAYLIEKARTNGGPGNEKV
jgi:hypothetical protein